MERPQKRANGERSSTPPPRDAPGRTDVETRAYYRYLERGGGQGSAEQDWLDAERELLRGGGTGGERERPSEG